MGPGPCRNLERVVRPDLAVPDHPGPGGRELQRDTNLGSRSRHRRCGVGHRGRGPGRRSRRSRPGDPGRCAGLWCGALGLRLAAGEQQRGRDQHRRGQHRPHHIHRAPRPLAQLLGHVVGLLPGGPGDGGQRPGRIGPPAVHLRDGGQLVEVHLPRVLRRAEHIHLGIISVRVQRLLVDLAAQPPHGPGDGHRPRRIRQALLAALQGRLQVSVELRGPLVAFVAVLGQGPAQHLVHAGRHGAHQVGDGRLLVVAHLVQDAGHGVAVKRQLAAQGVVADPPQGEDVRGVVHVLGAPGGLLGRHEVGRAEDRVVLGQHAGRVLDLGDAEVQDLGHVLVVTGVHQEDVLRLHVPVHDLPVVGRLHAAGHLLHDGRQLRRGQPPLPAQLEAQVLPVQILHDHVGGAVLHLVEVHHVDDVGVAQLAGDLRLPAEAGEQLASAGHVRPQQLDREPLLGQPSVPRLVHCAHAPLVDLAYDLIGAIQHLPHPALCARIACHSSLLSNHWSSEILLHCFDRIPCFASTGAAIFLGVEVLVPTVAPRSAKARRTRSGACPEGRRTAAGPR